MIPHKLAIIVGLSIFVSISCESEPISTSEPVSETSPSKPISEKAAEPVTTHKAKAVSSSSEKAKEPVAGNGTEPWDDEETTEGTTLDPEWDVQDESIENHVLELRKKAALNEKLMAEERAKLTSTTQRTTTTPASTTEETTIVTKISMKQQRKAGVKGKKPEIPLSAYQKKMRRRAMEQYRQEKEEQGE